jgi:hypothetical protein
VRYGSAKIVFDNWILFGNLAPTVRLDGHDVDVDRLLHRLTGCPDRLELEVFEAACAYLAGVTGPDRRYGAVAAAMLQQRVVARTWTRPR